MRFYDRFKEDHFDSLEMGRLNNEFELYAIGFNKTGFVDENSFKATIRNFLTTSLRDEDLSILSDAIDEDLMEGGNIHMAIYLIISNITPKEILLILSSTITNSRKS